jgi:hypothetical protein
VTKSGAHAAGAAAELTHAGREPRYIHGVIAREISTVTRYYDRVIQWLPREHDTGALMDLVEAPEKTVLSNGEPFPDLTDETDCRTAVLLNGTLNHNFDIQGLLVDLKARLAPASRVLVVLYNPYLRSAYWLANRLGLRRGAVPSLQRDGRIQRRSSR